MNDSYRGLLDGNFNKKIKKNTYFGKNKNLIINGNFLNNKLLSSIVTLYES